MPALKCDVLGDAESFDQWGSDTCTVYSNRDIHSLHSQSRINDVPGGDVSNTVPNGIPRVVNMRFRSR